MEWWWQQQRWWQQLYVVVIGAKINSARRDCRPLLVTSPAFLCRCHRPKKKPELSTSECSEGRRLCSSSSISSTLAWHTEQCDFARGVEGPMLYYTTQLVDMVVVVVVGIGPRLANTTSTRTEERALVYNFLLSKEPFLTAPFFPKRSSSSSSSSSSNSYSLDRRLRPPPCHGHSRGCSILLSSMATSGPAV